MSNDKTNQTIDPIVEEINPEDVSPIIEEGEEINPLTMLEALQGAGLDFPMQRRKMVIPGINSPNLGDHRALTRMDTGHVFALVTPTHKYTTPEDWAKAFDAAAPESDCHVWASETGQDMWFNVILGEVILQHANGEETPVILRLQGHNSYEDKGLMDFSIGAYITTDESGIVMPVLNGKGKALKVRPVDDAEKRVGQVKAALAAAEAQANALAEVFEQMVQTTITDEQVEALAHTLFPEPSKQDENKRAAFIQLYNEGADKGTAWGAMEALAHWATHLYQVRVQGRSAGRYSAEMTLEQVQAQARAEKLASGPSGALTYQALKAITSMVLD